MKTQSEVDAHAEAAVDAAIAEGQQGPLEIDGVDQILIMDALRHYAEFCRETAQTHKEHGKNLIAQTRLMMADDSERLYTIIANADRLVVS